MSRAHGARAHRLVWPSCDHVARGAGPVPGHAFGLDLSDADRAALLVFLRAL